MKTILVPTDFSQNANNALKYAAAIAKKLKAKLIIAHIINLPVTLLHDFINQPADDQLEQEYKAELNRLVNELRLENNFWYEVETICESGYFLANLNELVKTKTVDLVVMGTKGATNFLDKIVGTNSSQFVKIAACPVLVIPAEAVFKGIERISYASDFETEEKNYLQQLFGIAQPLEANVSIINILTERQLNIFSDNHIIREIVEQFPDNKFSIAQIQEKDVLLGLNEYVKENGADVLAVSLHERSFLEEIFHNSISKNLLLHTTLPLLTLPENPYRNPISARKPKAKSVYTD